MEHPKSSWREKVRAFQNSIVESNDDISRDDFVGGVKFSEDLEDDIESDEKISRFVIDRSNIDKEDRELGGNKIEYEKPDGLTVTKEEWTYEGLEPGDISEHYLIEVSHPDSVRYELTERGKMFANMIENDEGLVRDDLEALVEQSDKVDRDNIDIDKLVAIIKMFKAKEGL